MADTLTVVIPVYNEGANFPRLWDALTSQVGDPFVALVVYDFDQDDTLPVVADRIARGETGSGICSKSG